MTVRLKSYLGGNRRSPEQLEDEQFKPMEATILREITKVVEAVQMGYVRLRID
jgi:hypothetical protein